MADVYLVRHAESVYSEDDFGKGLTERGLEDVQKLKALFKKNSVDAVVSSPYRRAVQTVQGIAEEKGLKLLIEDDFRERRLSGQRVEDFETDVRQTWEDFDFYLPGGESNRAAQERGIQALFRIIDRFNGKSVAVGTHGNLLALMLNFFDASYDYSFWQKLRMPDVYKVRFSGNQLIEMKGIWETLHKK